MKTPFVTMKPTALLCSLVFVGLTGSAQAATWTIDSGSVNGMRVGAISFDGLPAGVEIGNITDDLNTSGLDYIAAGSWRDRTASTGGNSIDYHLQHEARIFGPEALDPQTASVSIMTLAGLDNAQITSPVILSAVALAPALVDVTFTISPEAGELAGQPVYVTFASGYDHRTHGTGFSPVLTSGLQLYHNNDLIATGWATGIGSDSSSWTFPAEIGDTFRLVMQNTSQVSIAGLALGPGSSIDALAVGGLDASLTISPIPEPETWAMLLAGIGLIGLQLRRKPRIQQKLEI